MAKKGKVVESSKDNELTMNYDGKEYSFQYDSLSRDAKANYSRANEIAASMMRLEQQVSEQRWLLNKYIAFVVGELDVKKELDEKEKK
tara:strand:- start:297 stop:560 length:264 start_codon:yes stop_codon:yes gene_type:complete